MRTHCEAFAAAAVQDTYLTHENIKDGQKSGYAGSDDANGASKAPIALKIGP